MLQDAGHWLLQAGELEQPLMPCGAERQLDSSLARVLLSFPKTALQSRVQIRAGGRLNLPTQINRAFIAAVRQDLAELHRRAFATAARAILSKCTKATVGAGLAANQACIGERFAGAQEWIGSR
ncbi:hypothetical protein D3C81_2005550 [compost metagenome]